MQNTTKFPASVGSFFPSIQGFLWYWSSHFLSQDFFTILMISIQLIFIGICCFFASQCQSSLDESRILSSAILLSVIISPIAWKHNYLLMVPAFIFLLKQGQWRSVVSVFFLMNFFSIFLYLLKGELLNESNFLLMGALVLFFSPFIGFQYKPISWFKVVDADQQFPVNKNL